MEYLQQNIDNLRKQIEGTYEGYEQILSACMKASLDELNHLHNHEIKKILSHGTIAADTVSGQISGERVDKNLIQYNCFIWNSDLGNVAKFMKQSFGFFSSTIRTAVVEKSYNMMSTSTINCEDNQHHSPRKENLLYGQSSCASKVELLGIDSQIAQLKDNRKLNIMQIRCKFGRLGSEKGQFNSPHGFCLGLQEEVLVADTHNHRIQVFEKNGTFLYEFGAAGKDKGELWYPRKIAVIKRNGNFVVCDRGNKRSRMQIFTKRGGFVRDIAIDYLDIVSGLVVTEDNKIVVVDSVKSTLFVISEFGDLHHWFNCSDYMREPSDIAVWRKQFYVCDFKGHSVVVFTEDGLFVRRIGNENLTNFPNGIDISEDGDILIGDSHGNKFHVAVFSNNGSLLAEFECPHVKLSRCCGLKITSEGYVVSLAKNNHHALVLNTLYIQ